MFSVVVCHPGALAHLAFGLWTPFVGEIACGREGGREEKEEEKEEDSFPFFPSHFCFAKGNVVV